MTVEELLKSFKEMEDGNPPHSRSVPPADLPKQECGEHTILDGSLYGADSTTTAVVVREMQRCMGQASQTVERGHFERIDDDDGMASPGVSPGTRNEEWLTKTHREDTQNTQLCPQCEDQMIMSEDKW